MIKRTSNILSVNIALVVTSMFAAVYVLYACNENGFELLFLLPLTFLLCCTELINCILEHKNSVFYFFFSAVAFVRYVVGPVLLTYTGEYFGRIVRYQPSDDSIRLALVLMVYEIIICTIFLYIKRKKKTNKYIIEREIELPHNMWLYYVLFFVTLLCTAINSDALLYFSFGRIGMFNLDISSINLYSQITIMLLLCSKCFLFIIVLSKLKALYDKSDGNYVFEFLAFLFTLLISLVYGGHNRADFLFSMICQLYIFTKLFPNNKKKYIIFFVIMGAVVLSFMTRLRGYTDYYTEAVGFNKAVLKITGIIGSYFGGITNVSVSVDFAEKYNSYRTINQFLKDILVPIVGINKLIPFDDGLITNSLFNYQFFQTTRQPSQILPSIGQGYFYFGFILSPLLDVMQLLMVEKLISIKNQFCKIELIYMFCIVEMRFALMFGQNITQQLNNLSMQLMLPVIVYFICNRFLFKDVYTKGR